MMDMEVPEPKEYLWCAKVDKTTKSSQWEGRDDGMKEQLVLKRACLGVGAKDGERNIVEVTSFNHEQNKIQTCLCSLTCGKSEDTSLNDLSLYPPAMFTLVQGTGPVHLVGNHIILDEPDELDSEDEDMSDLEDEDLSDLEEMEEEIKEDNPKKQKNEAKPKKAAVKQESSDSEGADDEEEEKKVEVKPVANKKRKAAEEKKGVEEKKGLSEKANNKTEPGSPQKKIKKDEVKSPKTPKTQQKENKLPASGKKTPAKVYETVDEVKAAIAKYPGGKPRKEEKFANWVKSAFRVKEEAWVKELWTAHKKEAGL